MATAADKYVLILKSIKYNNVREKKYHNVREKGWKEFVRVRMAGNSVERIAYLFGWYLLGPLNVTLKSVKRKFQQVSSSEDNRGKRLVVANVVGLLALMSKFQREDPAEKIPDMSGLVCRAFKLDYRACSSVESLFRQFAGSSISFSGLLNTLPELIGEDQKTRNLVFELLVYINNSILGLDWEKKLLLLRVADGLNVPFSEREGLVTSGFPGKETKSNDKLEFYRAFLDLRRNCSNQELQARYREIVKSIHPDLHPHEQDDVKQARITAMQELNGIYQQLLRPGNSA